MEAFAPARALYSSFGFTFTGPFEGYFEDPNSVFMTLVLN
jgi:putative acetyltransferase